MQQTCFDSFLPGPSSTPDPTAQPTNSPSKSPTKSPAPAPNVVNGCNIGIGTYQDTLTPTPGTCPTGLPNKPICCMDTVNTGVNIKCENTCSNCGAGPTQASCCTCTPGTNQYCCKTLNGGGYNCQDFGTACGVSGASSVEYAVDKNSGQICLLSEATDTVPNLVCSP